MKKDLDTGLQALIAMARFNNIDASPNQVLHELSNPQGDLTREQVLLGAERLNLTAKFSTASLEQLSDALLPIVLVNKDDSYSILVSMPKNASNGMQYSIQDLQSAKLKVLSQAQLTERFSGEILLIKKKQTLLKSMHKTFDISWFIESLRKYKKLFGEILIASFFIQLFALLTPLFFQVVMDKVLVHRGFTTLDVLAIGFFVLIAFESLLGGIRTYLFTHTTNMTV